MKTITEEKTMRMLNPVHPGRFPRAEIIEAHRLSVTEAAKILHVSRPALSSLLNAKADLSGATASNAGWIRDLIKQPSSVCAEGCSIARRRCSC